MADKGSNILVHNFAVEVILVTWTFGQGIAWAGLGTIAAAVGAAFLATAVTPKAPKKPRAPAVEEIKMAQFKLVKLKVVHRL